MEVPKMKHDSNLDAKPPKYTALGPKERPASKNGEPFTGKQLKEMKNYGQIPGAPAKTM